MGRMRQPDPGAEIGSFAALGDSFTEGLKDPDPDGGFIGWADRVAAVLAGQVPGFRYANLAIRGKRLPEVVAEQVPRAVELAPDLVSLAAGGNDILRGSDVDELAAQFDPAVAALQAVGCRVLIFTGFDPRIFPVIRLLRGRIAAYDMHLRAIADARGCDLVDLWSMRALKDARAWSADRLHLAGAGHQKVALRTCEVLGLPADGDWRQPLPPAAGPADQDGGQLTRSSAWLAARRQDARWAREYAMPWARRRLGGTSSGDGLPPKRPELVYFPRGDDPPGDPPDHGGPARPPVPPGAPAKGGLPVPPLTRRAPPGANASGR